MLITYRDGKEGIKLVEMKDASIEQLARSLELKNGSEIVIAELIRRFDDLEKIRIKYFQLKMSVCQTRAIAFLGGNF